MKYPKLRQTVLCQILLYLPVIVLCFGSTLLCGALDLSGVWIIVGWVLALVYILVNFVYLLIAEAMLFSIRNYKKQRREYITIQNGTTRTDVSRAVLSRLQRWGKQQPTVDGDYLLFYRNAVSMQAWYSRFQYRVVVYSAAHLTPEEYRRCRHKARHLFLKAPEGKHGWWQTKNEKSQPVCQINVLIILADTVAPECKVLPYRDHDPLVCLAECSTGKYYMNSELESYEQGVMPKPAQNYQVELLHKLVFDDHLPLESSPDAPPASGMFSPEDSLWTFLARTRRDFKDIDEESEREEAEMLKTLPENQVQMGECAIYYKYHSRLYICNCVPDGDDPKLLLSIFPDLESVGFNKDHSKLTRRDCSDAEKSRLMSAVRSWATVNGWRIEDCDDDES